MSLTRNVLFLGAALSSLAAAQTKISGSFTCGKPEMSQPAPVGDAKDHVIVLQQSKCTWTKPFEMEGVKSKDDNGVGVADVRGNTSQDQGWDVTTMANGDKLFVRDTGTTKMKDNVPELIVGKWNFTGGTGKFKGVKGGGTFKGAGKPDGSVTINVEGEYTIAK